MFTRQFIQLGILTTRMTGVSKRIIPFGKKYFFPTTEIRNNPRKVLRTPHCDACPYIPTLWSLSLFIFQKLFLALSVAQGLAFREPCTFNDLVFSSSSLLGDTSKPTISFISSVTIEFQILFSPPSSFHGRECNRSTSWSGSPKISVTCL